MQKIADVIKWVIWRTIATYLWTLMFFHILKVSPSQPILRYAFDFKLWYFLCYGILLFLSIWLKKKSKKELGWMGQFFFGFPLYLIFYPITVVITTLISPVIVAYGLQKASSWLWENINSAIVKLPVILLFVGLIFFMSYFPNQYLYWLTFFYGVFVVVYSLLSVGSWLFDPLATVRSLVFSTRNFVRESYRFSVKDKVDNFYADPSPSNFDKDIIDYLSTFYRYFSWVNEKLGNKNVQQGLTFIGFTATFLFHIFLSIVSFALFYFIIQNGTPTIHFLGSPEGTFLANWSSYAFYSAMVTVSGTTNFSPVSVWAYILSIMEVLTGISFLIITIIMFESFGISKCEQKVSGIKSSVKTTLTNLGDHIFRITKKYILTEDPSLPPDGVTDDFLSVESIELSSADKEEIWNGWINFLKCVDSIAEDDQKKELEELYTSLDSDQREDLISQLSEESSPKMQELLRAIRSY